MAYINSKKIKAYPVVNRDVANSGDVYARHTSEHSLTNIVNKLIDRDGFVITDKSTFSSDKPFSFNIHGYYFKIEQLSELISIIETAYPTSLEDGARVYAKIGLRSNGQWLELAEGDSTAETNPNSPGSNATTKTDENGDTLYEYQSVSFLLASPNEDIPEHVVDSTYYQVLLKYSSTLGWSNTNWYIPEDSWVKFDSASFRLDTIDAGDIDRDLT